MDAIRQAVVDGVVGLINTVADQAGLLVVAAFLSLGGWLKSRFSSGAQRQATLEAAVETEQWAAAEVVAGRSKPSGPEKKQRTLKAAKTKLPLRHLPWIPGAHGRLVEKVLPNAKRLSAPPPAPPEPPPSN